MNTSIQSLVSRLLAVALTFSGAAYAQERAEPSLLLELNALQPTEQTCRLIFVVQNGLPEALEQLSFEAVVFNQKDVVERLTLLDFEAVPHGKMRVRQFDLPNLSCDQIKRILINGTNSCANKGGVSLSCDEHLQLNSRTPVEIAG